MAGGACYNSPGEAFATTVHKIGHPPGHSHWSNVYFRTSSEVGPGQAWISLCEKYKFIIDKLFVSFECNEAEALYFVRGLRHCCVREIYFDLTDRWMKSLMHLYLMPPLKVLSFDRITGEGIVNLSCVLKDDRVKLESFFLVGTPETTFEKQSDAIAESFKWQFGTLQILALSRIMVMQKHFIEIAKTLQDPQTKLQEMYLEGVEVGEKGAQFLAEGIGSPYNILQKLWLDNNGIGDAGTVHLAKALRSPECKLQELQLKRNEIGNKGAQALADSLDGMLKRLDISFNEHVTEDGAMALAHSLQQKYCTLQELIIEYCNIGRKGVEKLTKTLQDPNCPLVKLTLPVSEETDLVAVADCLQACQLQQLTLRASNSKLDLKEGQKCILSALDSYYWCSLKSLFLYDDITIFKEELEKTFEDWRSQKFSFMPLPNPRLLIPDSWCPEKRMISFQLGFWKPLERLSIQDHNQTFGKTRDSLISRNAAICEGDLLKFEKEQPPTSKLFVCGKDTVAKQSIIDYISRPSKWYKRNAPLRSYMNLSLTQISDENQEKLLVSEVCETDDYFPFFSAKPRQSLFLIVCNAPSALDVGQPELNRQLCYWLKSIASSSSYHGPKPKVIICLAFPKGKKNLRCIARFRTEHMIREFQDVIDFGPAKDNNVFAVLDGSKHEVKLMKEKMEKLFLELRYEAFSVPKICVDLLNFIPKLWGKKNNMFPISSFENLVCKFQKHHSNATEVNIRTALQLLHSNGYVVYHPTSEIVILALEFFAFLVRDLRSTRATFMAKEDIAMRISDQMQVHVDLVYQVLYSLHLEGIIHPVNEAWAGDFGKVPKQFLNPMLVATRLPKWPNDIEQKKQAYWGRRFECVDKIRTTIPQQLFRKLQLKQGQLLHFKQEKCDFGAEYIYFSGNSIQVIVHIGGEKEGWSDKQWIDVMFKISEERRYDYQQDIILAQILNQIEDICYADYVCPTVHLEEKVIRNDAVERLELGNANTECLSVIMSDLCMHGGNHLHSWKDGRSSKLKDLLTPLEFKIHLSDLRSEVMEEFGLCTPRPCSSSSSRRLGLREILGKWLRNLLGTDKLEEQLREMNMSLKELKAEMEKGFQNLERSGDELNSMLTSKLLQLIALVDLPFPRLPYLTNEHGVLQVLSVMYQTTSRLHFMCEWKGGAHHIEGDHNGLQLKLKRKWVVEAAPILVPALKLLVLAARVSATGLSLAISPIPLPSFTGEGTLRRAALPEVLKTFAAGLEAELASDWHAKPAVALLKTFLEQTLKGKVISLLNFGLYKVQTPSGISYLCHQHSKGYQCTEDQSLRF